MKKETEENITENFNDILEEVRNEIMKMFEEEEEHSYTLDGKWRDVDFASDLVKGHVKAIKLVGIKDKNVSENKD